MKVSSNFLKSLGWIIGSVTHSAESNEEFLQGLVDPLRAVYQLKSEDLREQGVELPSESWCVLKHCLTAWTEDVEDLAKRKREGKPVGKVRQAMEDEAKIIRDLIDHYEVKKRAEKKKGA